MNIKYFVIFLAFICTSSQAQNLKTQLINSGDVLKEGINFHQDGKFKDAIKLYKTISRSDTNYNRALYELSLSYYSDSNFIESKNCAEKGLNLFPDEASDWFILMASALDELGNHNAALSLYDSSLKKDSNKYMALFNKGVTFYKLHNYAKAKEALESCLMIYPYYASAHYYLGNIALEEGDVVSAFLCYITNLLVYPENNHANDAIKSLSNISSITDEIVQKVNLKNSQTSNPFELIEEILLSKIALDTKYKLNSEVEDPITRQIQVVLEKLESEGTTDHFFLQFYAPFYRKLYADNKFNLFINHIFKGLDIKSINEFKKKHAKELEEFIDYILDYFNQIRNTRILIASNRSNASTIYLYNNNVFAGKGPWNKEANKIKYTGYWEFFHTNGSIKSKGTFNQNENKEGEWFFYYPNGNLKEKTWFNNDSAQGKSTYWYNNGILNEDKFYKNDLLNGKMKEYYYSGQLKTELNFESDKKQGAIVGYFKNGLIEYESGMVNNIQEGKTIFYHPNGKISSTSFLINGMPEGKIITYHENGAKEMEGNKIQNLKTGIWETFYPSGKIHEHYSYIKDELSGESIEYYENGMVKDKSFYIKGLIDNKEELFDEDGIKYCEIVYEKGKLKEIHHFTKEGKEISQGTLRKGKSKLEYFSPTGIKIESSDFSAEGLREGRTEIYYSSGKISSYAKYKNGKLNGPRVAFYRNGQISDSSFFKDDEINGYAINYHDNGKPKNEGWFVDGQKQGLHIEYNYLGEVMTEYYYQNDVLNGYLVSHSPNGKIEYEELFEDGWLKKITQYDSSNHIFFEEVLNKGIGNVTFYNNNKRPYWTSQYEKYQLQGKSISLYFDASISRETYYKNGELDSISRDYYYGGKLHSEGYFQFGKKEGKWKYFFENQQLSYETNYQNGNENGSRLMLTEDGRKDKILTYKDGELDGPATYYGEDGSIAFILNYNKGKLVSYTYENMEGKLIPNIKLNEGTGIAKCFYKNGNKSAEIEFDDGVYNGSRKIYFTNGNLFIESFFKWGLEVDSKKVYYSTGILQSEDNYINNSKMGTSKCYYPNGKLKVSQDYYLDSLNGASEYFDENGTKIETRLYYYDVLQMVKK